MAVKHLTLTCDYCQEEDDECISLEEANEVGWFLVTGPERDLGGDGERAYCCRQCLIADLL